MCNIAGYVGERHAAPILIEMIKREEGFAGGFYTGIATLHEGQIHYRKLIGDTDRLVALTDAASLPGTVGFIHSRSKSGGDDRWAHPFVCERNGEVVSAYVANGSTGFFSACRKMADSLADELNADGYVMHSRGERVGGYPTLSDGTCVHMSDLMAQLIRRHMDVGKDSISAMEAAFHEMPGEIVGLLLTLSSPESITWSRINMPMFVGFSAHGAYMASSSLAFPPDAGKEILLPPMSSGRIYADRYTVVPYREDVCSMSRIDDRITSEAYHIISDLLKSDAQPFSVLYKAITHLFGDCACNDSEPLAYHILQALASENRLHIDIVRVAGVMDGVTAPKSLFSLKK